MLSRSNVWFPPKARGWFIIQYACLQPVPGGNEIWRKGSFGKYLFFWIQVAFSPLIETTLILQKSTWHQVIYYAKKFGLFLLILGAYCSFLSAYDYEPYSVGEGVSLWDVGQLANNALVAREWKWCFFSCFTSMHHCIKYFLSFFEQFSSNYT